MNSVGENQKVKVDRIKTKRKLRIPNFFNSIFAKISPSKLTVDAVPVNKNGLIVTSASTSAADVFEESRVNSIVPWPGTVSDEFEGASFVSENAMISPSSQLTSPNANHLASYGLQNTTSNSLAVNNVGVQNNFNLSDINGLHIGNVNVFQEKAAANGSSDGGNHGAEQGNEGSRSASKILKTKTIKELLVSKVPLDEDAGKKTMRILSRHMGASWRFTLRDLGFSDAQIDQKCSTYLNLTDGVYEIIYRSLLEWSRENVDVTVGKLCTILWDRGDRECVLELKKELKRKREKNVSESSSTAENGAEFETPKKSTEDNPNFM